MIYRTDEGQQCRTGLNYIVRPDWWRIVLHLRGHLSIYLRHRNRKYYPEYKKLWIFSIDWM